MTEDESAVCGISVGVGFSAVVETSLGVGTAVGVSEVSGACTACSVTSCAESQHGKSNRNAK